MIHSLRPLALVFGLLICVPVYAADSDQTDKDKYDRILRELQAMHQTIEDMRTVATQVQATTRDVRELQRRVENLESAFERLAAARTRVAGSYSPPENAAPAALATIRLQNRYSVPATVYINDRAISVPAYQSRLLTDVPAGPFTYEVQAEGFGVIQPSVNRMVGPNETFSIFINPPSQTAQQAVILP